jgi:hypothetical protein
MHRLHEFSQIDDLAALTSWCRGWHAPSTKSSTGPGFCIMSEIRFRRLHPTTEFRMQAKRRLDFVS